MTEEMVCDRCDEYYEDRFCIHRDLCPDCVWTCAECAAEVADDHRAEAAFGRWRER